MNNKINYKEAKKIYKDKYKFSNDTRFLIQEKEALEKKLHAGSETGEVDYYLFLFLTSRIDALKATERMSRDRSSYLF